VRRSGDRNGPSATQRNKLFDFNVLRLLPHIKEVMLGERDCIPTFCGPSMIVEFSTMETKFRSNVVLRQPLHGLQAGRVGRN